MRDTLLIRELRLEDFLSFATPGVSVGLRALNVLIGPNGSGKSNVLEALAVLRASPGDLAGLLRSGGGVTEYIWKGDRNPDAAWIEVELRPYVRSSTSPLVFGFFLTALGTRLEIIHEYIYRQDGVREFLYKSGSGTGTLNSPLQEGRAEAVAEMKADKSILSQLRDPITYPEITYIGDRFSSIALFQDWNVARRSAARLPQPTDLPNDFLLPDGSNLGLILHDLSQTSAKRDEVSEYLRKFYERARYITTKIQGGTLQLYIEEEGGRLIPATRLSDGTLRYLCLLAILLHPNPPPVIGIEEPELGLHPDILPTIAELLRKASERTQLFVTTHSETLVSALSDTPECILVCESTPDGTTMKRLEAEPLREWLEKYSLGELWRMGEIGGNRW
ncbi:AAA family ATPase [Longimicrobium sp.]|jgi:predicted ATPase|uniref:AAA family ATPase n=1 Tax=Longimicrobium sp. TaxID=2029185 RepID=UPI002EDB0A4B